MFDENLGNAIMFMIDAILADECEYTEIDVSIMDAALLLTQIAWNTEILGETALLGPYAPALQLLERADHTLWDHLIRENANELIDILRKRKRFFFPDDTRLIRQSFCNILGTITVEEENDDGTIHIGK
jgi:hypothetical protein